MRMYLPNSEYSTDTKRIEVNLGNLGIELDLDIEVYLCPNPNFQPVFVDTPVDILRGNPNSFCKRLMKEMFETEIETFRSVKRIHDLVFTDEPRIFPTPVFLFDCALRNLTASLEQIKYVDIVFIGRSSRLPLLYTLLKKSHPANLYWLRSRNESKGGLEDLTVRSGIAQLCREIKRRKHENVLLVDDLLITGKTMRNIGNSLRETLGRYDIRVVGLPLLANIYTFITQYYPRKNIPSREESLEIYLSLLSNSKKGRVKNIPENLRKDFQRVPIIGGVVVIADYANTLSHICGDSIEQFQLLFENYRSKLKAYNSISLSELENLKKTVEDVSAGLMNNYTKPLDLYLYENLDKNLVILPKTR